MDRPYKPRRMLLSRSRSIVRDILHCSERMPLCAHERQIELTSINEVRKQCETRISWPVIFIKAYGMVAESNPLLRRWYVDWPFPHVHQHHENVAKLVLRREHNGEDWLFWAGFHRPEQSSLEKLQQELDRYQTAPVERTFRKQLSLAALPTPLRRMLWWCTRNFASRKRAKRMGTYSLTTVAGQGTMIPQPPSMLTSTISYGPIDEHGRATVALTYDHRLMDGHHVADFLEQLDNQLHTTIVTELEQMTQRASPESIGIGSCSPQTATELPTGRVAGTAKHVA